MVIFPIIVRIFLRTPPATRSSDSGQSSVGLSVVGQPGSLTALYTPLPSPLLPPSLPYFSDSAFLRISVISFYSSDFFLQFTLVQTTEVSLVNKTGHGPRSLITRHLTEGGNN